MDKPLKLYEVSRFGGYKAHIYAKDSRLGRTGRRRAGNLPFHQRDVGYSRQGVCGYPPGTARRRAGASLMDGGKLLYKCRDVSLVLHEGKYFVRIEGEGVRRRIGDMLEREGKNRYTGEPLEQSEGVKKDAE